MTARLVSDRGTTAIDDRVIVAIACRAAAGTPGIGGVAGRLGSHAGAGEHPRGSTSAEGDRISPRVRISVAYPASVREVTRQARKRIQHELRTMTGLRVGPVDIDVAALPQGTWSS
ncbi:Asp23/Gls24 family envelope stress response protein [Actinomadura fulvescens]|uniref:Asp23/Gls24 family envelope stress response protein n=1 Tax=Actinomadura fulvescens TaxID=46160 RepID=A0ABN3PGL9_9ACTN